MRKLGLGYTVQMGLYFKALAIQETYCLSLKIRFVGEPSGFRLKNPVFGIWRLPSSSRET